jgi:Arc/MetJ-type ribon-helix-helix transcriptional regulator
VLFILKEIVSFRRICLTEGGGNNMAEVVREVLKKWKEELEQRELKLRENLETIQTNLEIKRAKLWVVELALHDIKREVEKDKFFDAHGKSLAQEIENDEIVLEQTIKSTREKVHHLKLLIQNIERELQNEQRA